MAKSCSHKLKLFMLRNFTTQRLKCLQERYSEAVPLFKRALSIRQQTHEDTIETEERLERTRRKQVRAHSPAGRQVFQHVPNESQARLRMYSFVRFFAGILTDDDHN